MSHQSDTDPAFLLGNKKQVRIGCITWPDRPKRSVSSIDFNVGAALAAIGWMSSARPDIVCLPEGFLYSGMAFDSAAAVAVEPNSSILGQFARLAKELRLYLAVPLYERSVEAIHNVVALFGRDGSRIGTHRKNVLWPSNESLTQFEKGISPGSETVPVPTEFGPIGIQVCLELHSPDPWAQLKAKGVRLILFPSEQSGGLLLRYRAWETNCFIASAVSKGGPSRVIDPVGAVVGEWWPESPNAVLELSLDYELVHADHNEQKIEALTREFPCGIEVTKYGPERLYKITSRDAALDVKLLLNERGIIRFHDYLSKIFEASAAAARSCLP
jgi:predicted amidohydrolase